MNARPKPGKLRVKKRGGTGTGRGSFPRLLGGLGTMGTFKVLQFNMQFGQSWDDDHPDDSPIDLDLTLAEICSHNADIILLQEVEQARAGGSQSGNPSNYARIRETLKDYDAQFSFPKADPRELPFGIGQAIFSKRRWATSRASTFRRHPCLSNSWASRKRPPTA